MSIQHPAQNRTGHQVSTHYPFTALAPPSFPSRPDLSILLDGRSEGLLAINNHARNWTGKDIRSCFRRFLMTINVLPDDVLLEIFDFLLTLQKEVTEEWITLAHVCRRWRSVVFQSPLRLNLQLLCTPRTRVRDTLDMWPPLPLIIHGVVDVVDKRPSSADNIVAALEHNDRVCEIQLDRSSSRGLECVTHSAAMQKPFPELTHLLLRVNRYDVQPILPDSFLGGTVPRLRLLDLNNSPFPGLPKLLLSATHLVHLDLDQIPPSGYIPPEVMATSLSALSSLESLRIHFQYPRPRPALETRRPPLPPPTRSILPSLTQIEFKGASEYMEEILTRIDAPRLGVLHITFFNQIIFDTPQLFQFISRRPTLTALKTGYVEFNSGVISVRFRSRTSNYGFGVLGMKIRCTPSEWQLSSVEQVCTSSLPPVSTLEDLYIVQERLRPPSWDDGVETILWLDLLRPFVAVKNLYLSDEFVPRIAPALQELVGGRTTEVLPGLENIFWRGFQPTGPIHEGVDAFVAARRLTSHPVTISRWERKTYGE